MSQYPGTDEQQDSQGPKETHRGVTPDLSYPDHKPRRRGQIRGHVNGELYTTVDPLDRANLCEKSSAVKLSPPYEYAGRAPIAVGLCGGLEDRLALSPALYVRMKAPLPKEGILHCSRAGRWMYRGASPRTVKFHRAFAN